MYQTSSGNKGSDVDVINYSSIGGGERPSPPPQLWCPAGEGHQVSSQRKEMCLNDYRAICNGKARATILCEAAARGTREAIDM